MAEIHRIGLDEVARHFEELEDPRSTVNRLHPLVSVVVIALMAVLAGADGPTGIAKWAALKEKFLLEALDLPNGIPRKDVFRRVLVLLKPHAFQACFANWLQSLRATAAETAGVKQPVFAVDGKTARRSHDRGKGLGALHSGHSRASEVGGHQRHYYHDRRHGNAESHCQADRRKRSRLCTGAERKPGVVA